MSFEAISWVLHHSPARRSARLVHIALADWAGDDLTCSPSHAQIAGHARLSLSAVTLAIKDLEAQGLVVVMRDGPGAQPNRYRLMCPPGGLADT